MLLKCSHCTYQRNIFQIPALRAFRTSTASFSSDKDNIRDRYVPPEKRSLFGALFGSVKEHRTKNMMIDEPPEKESIGTILKVQRVPIIPNDFKTVYKFPKVKYFALVNRFKIYQTMFAVTATSLATALYAFGIVTSDVISLNAELGIFGCLTFYSLGYVAANFVGFIYYNEKTKMVRIAYVDFWGRRRDIELPASDIVPRSESTVGLINKVWFPLKRYSTKETLKLQLEEGLILDNKLLKKIL